MPLQPFIVATEAAGSAKPEPRTDPTELRFPPQDPARQRAPLAGSAAPPRPGPRRYLPATAALRAALVAALPRRGFITESGRRLT